MNQSVHQAADHPWFEKLARFGYATKGNVYPFAGEPVQLKGLENIEATELLCGLDLFIAQLLCGWKYVRGKIRCSYVC